MLKIITMKKNILFLTLIVVILSACNTAKDAFVMKRKYSKGFYVAHHSKKHKSTNNENDIVKGENPDFIQTKTTHTFEKNIENQEIKDNNFVASNSSVNSDVAIKLNSKNAAEKEFKNSLINKTLKNVFVEYKSIKSNSKSKQIDSKRTSSLSSDQIVQLILALFPILCLIAVYLKDGGKITNNFWITLVLHLTVYLECIFAVLVVLDIINLA
jgi:preprotein translocase subunit SecF